MSLTLTRSERGRARAYRAMIKRARRRAPRPKLRSAPLRGRHIDKGHKAAVAQLFCIATFIRHGMEVYGVHVAHLRFSSHRDSATNPGLQRKPDDRWVLPLSPNEHRLQHSMGERAYWEALGVDPHNTAKALSEASPNFEDMRGVLRGFCRMPRPRSAIRSTNSDG
jgi:hypothetical protein